METIKLKYDGYLTEQKLIQLFKDLQKSINIDVKTNVKIGKRYRGDLIINNKYLIEFDGYRHYTQAKVDRKDLDKDNIWINTLKRNEVIRIPYFVQLTTEIFNFYFKNLLEEINVNIEIIQNYRHGFIDKKAILPADFCSLGINRFYMNINNIPLVIKEKIIDSLFDLIFISEDKERDIYEIFDYNYIEYLRNLGKI